MDEYKNYNDSELQEKFIQGDKLAEEVLVRRYMLKVRICAHKYYLLGGDNDDLIQEGTIGLIAAARTYDPESNATFNTYAEHCINSRLIDAVKRQIYRPYISTEELTLPADSEYTPDPEEQFIQEEQYRELLSEFSSVLSKFENQVFELFISGSSYSEIAGCLGKSSQSIYNAVQRIRQKLSAKYISSGNFSKS